MGAGGHCRREVLQEVQGNGRDPVLLLRQADAGRRREALRGLLLDGDLPQAHTDRAAFWSAGTGSAFEEFGEWLLGEAGFSKTTLAVHHFLPFFRTAGAPW